MPKYLFNNTTYNQIFWGSPSKVMARLGITPEPGTALAEVYPQISRSLDELVQSNREKWDVRGDERELFTPGSTGPIYKFMESIGRPPTEDTIFLKVSYNTKQETMDLFRQVKEKTGMTIAFEDLRIRG